MNFNSNHCKHFRNAKRNLVLIKRILLCHPESSNKEWMKEERVIYLITMCTCRSFICKLNGKENTQISLVLRDTFHISHMHLNTKIIAWTCSVFLYFSHSLERSFLSFFFMSHAMKSPLKYFIRSSVETPPHLSFISVDKQQSRTLLATFS